MSTTTQPWRPIVAGVEWRLRLAVASSVPFFPSTATHTAHVRDTIEAGAAISARADRAISVDLANGPMVTNPGRFLVVMLRVPVGTATASQIVQGMVTLKGYFE
jgi:hypothetical protein